MPFIHDARAAAAGTLFAAAAWPSLVSALGAHMLSPLERATRDAWCGLAPHAQFELLGHCPACWAGSAVLALTAATIWASASAPRRSTTPRR